MPEYIEREAFEEDVRLRYCKDCTKRQHEIYCRSCWVDDMLGEVEDAPAADVEAVRHGEWVCVNDTDNVWMCDGADGCGGEIILLEGTPLDNEWERCPYCGAKMDGKGAENG